MTTKIRKWWWVLVLVQFCVGCMGAQLDNDGSDVGADDGGFEDVAPDAGGVVIRPGAIDLRDQAKSVVEDAQKKAKTAEEIEEAEAAQKTKEAEEPQKADKLDGAKLPALSGKPMRLFPVELREVSKGWQVSIPCTDDSVEKTRYDRQARTRRSRRCEIDTNSARLSLEFEPSISYQLSSTPQGLLVSADFERRKYKLTIKAGLRTRDGGELQKDVESEFTVGKLSPTLEFIAQGRYMPREAWKEVTLSHRNVEAGELEVWHVPGRNMAFWMSGYAQKVKRRSGDLILSKQLQLKDTVDAQLTTTLPMRELLGSPEPGLYEIQVEASKKDGNDTRRDTKADVLRVVVTDMQLIAKRSNEEYAEEVDVWAVNSRTLKPIANAEVSAVLMSGTVAAKCRTNRAGYCRVRVETGHEDEKKSNVQARTPFALVVTHNQDATYLKYTELQTKLARGKTHGAPYKDDGAYKGFAYGDRDLYRPADVVHVAAMVRDKDLKSVGAGVPVDLVVVDSRAQIVARKTRETNAGGMVTLDHRLSDMAPTGQWRVRVEIGKREVATFKFGVEEFMPERLEVEATAASEHIGPQDPFNVDVHARYLFGASAVGSPVTMRCEQKEMPFQPPKHASYRYGVLASAQLGYDDDRDQRRMVTAKDAKIDADDNATLGCDFAANQAEMASTTRLRAEVGVSESGSGRTTHAIATGWRHPESYYIGVRSNRDKISRGKPVTIEGVVVDWDGELRTDIDTVDLSVIQLRRRWGYWYYRNRYKRQWIQVIEASRSVPVSDGKFSYTFTPQSYAYNYAVRLRSGGARTDLKLRRSWSSRWQYGRGGRTPGPKDANSLVLDSRGKVAINKAHKVRFESDVKGRALMTVETDEVLQSAWIDVEPGEVEWSFQVDAFAPNIYVSTMLLKDPHAESDESYLPERSFGALSIPMKRDKFTQKIDMRTPESIRPGRALEVKLDLGKGASGRYVTVAAVDQGILSLTDYKSPNPLDSLLRRRALGVRTYDTIGWALQLAKINPNSKTGGGGEQAQPKLSRVMPFKPVALWSGLRKVPKSGKLSVSFDVPLYQGELRVMAVASSDTQMGSAETRVKVRDPIVVQPTLPRFLIVGDQVDIPVFLSNTTADTQQIKVDIAANPMAEPGLIGNPTPADMIGILGDQTQTISVESGKSKMVLFKARALRSGGAAKVVVSATARSEDGEVLKSRAENIVPFRAAGPLERKVETMMVSTKHVDLAPILEGWEPSSEKTTFRLSTNPYGGAFDHLSELARYPYGCLEQTSSKLRPLLYMSDLISAVDPELVAKSKGIDKMVASGIKRILSMQTSSGGFGFWNGASEPHRWATPYATYLLMDAKKHGYAVPQERITHALDWIEGDVKRQQKNGYGHSNYYSNRYSPGFAYYVLALAGRANQGQIRKMIEAFPKEKEEVKGEEFEGLYLLKAALYLSGDRSYEADLKAFDVDLGEKYQRNHYSYYSTRRRNAMLLNVFVDIFGPDPSALGAVEQLGQLYSQTKNVGYLYSTQELGWALTALGKWYASDTGESVSGQIRANGQLVKSEHRKSKHNTDWGMVRASEYDALSLEVDKLPESPLYLIASSAGVRTEPNVEYGGHGLSVTREYLNEKGEAIDENIELGDLVYVRVRLKSTSHHTLRNIALVDRLPAGFEIENANLGSEIMPSWASNHRGWNTDHMNVRDDRLEAFGSIRYGRTVELVYAVRATLAGKFHAPSIEAEGMYDTKIWARATFDEIEITHKWDGLID